MRRIIARLLQYTITRLFMPATVPYYCLTLLYGTLYTPLYLKGIKSLTGPECPNSKKSIELFFCILRIGERCLERQPSISVKSQPFMVLVKIYNFI